MAHALTVVLGVSVMVALCVGVGYLARSFRRSALNWVLLSLVLNPIVAGIVLFLVGPRKVPVVTPDGVVTHPISCPACGSPVDTVTGSGLHSPTDQPWLLLCDHCQHEIPAEA